MFPTAPAPYWPKVQYPPDAGFWQYFLYMPILGPLFAVVDDHVLPEVIE
jgi:hypothetical protein